MAILDKEISRTAGIFPVTKFRQITTALGLATNMCHFADFANVQVTTIPVRTLCLFSQLALTGDATFIRACCHTATITVLAILQNSIPAFGATKSHFWYIVEAIVHPTVEGR
jgi:hypothetical protein